LLQTFWLWYVAGTRRFTLEKVVSLGTRVLLRALVAQPNTGLLLSSSTQKQAMKVTTLQSLTALPEPDFLTTLCMIPQALVSTSSQPFPSRSQPC
jgi:hypothetical protein